MGHLEVGRKRVIIEGVRPEIDGGRYPAKRVVGDRVVVEADIYADGHDAISAVLQYQKAGDVEWQETPMVQQSNDRWRAVFEVSEIGYYRYTVLAWVDRFRSWRESLRKHAEAKQEVTVEILIGADLLVETSQRASASDKRKLLAYSSELRSGSLNRVERAEDLNLHAIMEKYQERGAATRYEKELTIAVDREKARFSTWYEMFPRSCSTNPGKHGTLKDCEKRLEYIANLGFDVLYLPPIHPIGETHRKGRNNSLRAGSKDPGSPWAIGGVDGGHKDIHPELGTLSDFRKLVKKAEDCGVELAMDLALHCSPDHPYVREHPEWFRNRPDGTIQYAENPPKKYQDIYPLDFSGEHWREIWDELRSVVLFWIQQGVRIYRVDNPHTKPFSFWEFLINGVKREHPDVIFLAEAFTRPKVM
nr:DUF3416 domain-containing protein [Deltaproteobacteria bacterium]